MDKEEYILEHKRNKQQVRKYYKVIQDKEKFSFIEKIYDENFIEKLYKN